MIVQDIAQAFAAYLDFLVDFLAAPARALVPYARVGKVSKDLTLFTLVGVGLALVIASAGAAFGVGDETSTTLAFLGRLHAGSAQLLPLVTLLVTVVLAVLAHGTIRAVQRGALAGSVKDSINGALAFAAMFIPVSAAAIAVVVVSADATSPAPGVVGIVLAVVTVVYFALALRGVHARPQPPKRGHHE